MWSDSTVAPWRWHSDAYASARRDADVRAQSVTGPVDSVDLGITLPHEHLNASSTFLCTDATASRVPIDEVDPVELRRQPMRFLANLDMRDEAVAAAELSSFAGAGGATLVDLTPDLALARDPELLLRLSMRTGVHVVMGTGYYVQSAHPAELASLSVGQIADRMVGEIRDGVGADRIRAGIIGEIGTGDPILPGEIRVVRAAAVAHLETGCPVNIHMAAGCREVFNVLGVLSAEGITDLGRIVISHMDVVLDIGLHKEVAAAGALVEYDTFGHEAYPDSRGYLMPTDQQRVEALAEMVAAGFGGSLLVSQDVCFRHLWRHHGGLGYTNLLTRARDMMAAAGLTDDVQRALLVENPGRMLAYLP